ncbi:MAG: exo-alpha-sialidase [Ruminococcaceae bacterium]|nr:exo-alpha-sialidase [Oscillospiraceae bacterium]
MHMYKEENSIVSKILPPTKGNPRNSEGDFIRLKDGRIMFAYSYYHDVSDENDSSPCDIRCLISDDDGRTFHADSDDGLPRLLVSASKYGVDNIMSVSLCRMNNGDIGLFYMVKHRLEEQEDGEHILSSDYVLARSSDEGVSFYTEKSILPRRYPGYYVVNNSRVQRLSDGRLVVPMAQHAYRRDVGGGCGENGSVWFLFSDDDGETWYRNAYRLDCPDSSYSFRGLQEPGIIELPNGVLYAHARSAVGCHYESVSIDKGVHWFSPQRSRFTSPLSPLTIGKNPYTGKYYAVWTPVPEYNGKYLLENSRARTPLVMAQSDDGYNFDLDNIQIIEPDRTGWYCYTAMFFADEKTMLLSYCSTPASIGNLAQTTIRRIELEK